MVLAASIAVSSPFHHPRVAGRVFAYILWFELMALLGRPDWLARMR